MNAKELAELWEPHRARWPLLSALSELSYQNGVWCIGYSLKPIDDQTAAARLRDAAVLALWPLGFRVEYNDSPWPGYGDQRFGGKYRLISGAGERMVSADTPAHALAATVGAVLDAKAPALNPDTWRGTSMAGGYEPDGAKE